jgi:hypothetical protein
MKTTTELQLRKVALVLTAVVLLQLLWTGISLLLMSDPEPIVPAEASLRVDVIQFGIRQDEEFPQNMVSRPLFWEGRQAYTPPPAPLGISVPKEEPRASTAIDEVELLGVYSGGGNSGIIIAYKRERRRLRLEESIEDWKFTLFNADTALFESGGESRLLKLEHAVPKAGVKSKASIIGAGGRKDNPKKGKMDSSAAAELKANPEKGATNNQNDKGE